MTESSNIEPRSSPAEIHTNFLRNRKALVIAGLTGLGFGSMITMGTPFVIDGLAQFITGTAPSAVLANVDSSVIPGFVKVAAEHMSQMPSIIKTGGGTALMSTGTAMLGLGTAIYQRLTRH